ncbi:MAG: hypothetical protein V4727_02010 [Verrucomicrobiota bacterium]
MNDSSNQPVTPLSMEEGVQVLLSNARQGIRRRYQKCNNRIRKSPTSAVIGAAAVGYVLHRLPVRAILVTQVRVLSALTPPALILFGAAKLYDFLQKQELVKRK